MSEGGNLKGTNLNKNPMFSSFMYEQEDDSSNVTKMKIGDQHRTSNINSQSINTRNNFQGGRTDCYGKLYHSRSDIEQPIIQINSEINPNYNVDDEERNKGAFDNECYYYGDYKKIYSPCKNNIDIYQFKEI